MVSKVDALGRAAGARLPRVLAGAAGGLRRQASARSSDVLGARNITLPGGMLEVGDKNLTVDPSGEFKSEQEIGDVLRADDATARRSTCATSSTCRAATRARRASSTSTAARDADGTLAAHARHHARGADARRRSRSATSARPSTRALAELRQQLPDDLRPRAHLRSAAAGRGEHRPVHGQPLRGDRRSSCSSSLIGFWEWRSALLMALSIPITLAMTFGMMYLLGIDLQQVSIASLIIALGLLVDDPVVAGDAIKRDLAAGHPPHRRRLARARPSSPRRSSSRPSPTSSPTCRSCSCRATPGEFIYSLPVVIGCSLVASRLVSMTFIPLLGYYLLRPKAEPTIEERRTAGFAALYYRVGRAGDRAPLGVPGGVARAARRRRRASASQLKTQFFPKDLSYLSYVDVWLPEDAPLVGDATAVAEQVEAIDPARRRRVRRRSTARPASAAQVLRVADDLRRRRRAALLVLGRAGAAQLELRAGAHRGVRQARHRAPGRAAAGARSSADDPRRAHRRAAARDRRRRSASRWRSASRARTSPTLRALAAEVAGDPPRDPDADARPRRLGRRELRGAAADRSRPREPGRAHQPRRRRRLGVGDERRAGRRCCARATSRSRSSRGCGWRSARSSSDIADLYVYSPQRHAEGAARRRSRRSSYEHADREAAAPQPVPHDHGLGVPGGRRAAVGGAERGDAASSRRCSASLPPGYRLEIGGEQEEQVEGLQRTWRS